jgi:eukaryotic-like serine/threonine-protein kinase
MDSPAPEPQLAAGDTLAGRYRLERLLGEGGMGFVWQARQLTTDKAVAIKVLKSQDAADTARFLREAKVAAALSHRNIIQVFDFWEMEGKGPVFMVMELLHGETLAERLERTGPLPTEQVLTLVMPVASAVRAAHARGVVHRDLKPDNIFLARVADADAPEVKVVDFGLAKPFIINVGATALTQTGSVMGTPYYMAPEQVYGEKDIDGQADVWALGVILYECATGTRPFEGENFGQIFRRVTHGLYTPLRELAPSVPPALEALVVRALSHDRDKRPTMAEVHETLVSLRVSASLLPAAPPGAARGPSYPSAGEVVPGTPRDRSPFFSPPAGVTPPGPPMPISAPPARTMVSSTISVARRPSRGASTTVVGIAVGVLVTVGVAVGLAAALRTGAPKKASVDLGALAVPSASAEPPPPTLPLPEPPPPASAAASAPAADPTALANAPTASSDPPKSDPRPKAGKSKPVRPAGATAPGSSASSGPTDPLNRGRF